ncbi:E3 ubiquitin-protein ligase RNF168-like [Pollicipes pollicipes]|uniref:E3 ubiquitin-protein ligase RNF168-like n=1 Tax=Pollicipes pollicipes TaxID=41117 RepID=UPI001885566B|nr:E3 ubiquitin-protein ligase RNF168-like [Pollicipes pollicipes]
MASEARLTAAAATCPVCLSILVRPVTMPCGHALCMPCFDATVEQASLSCPLCRTRISVWLRRARKSDSLVDERLWARLRRDFPAKVEARLEGQDADFSSEDLDPVPQHLSEPGEIRQEFEQQLATVLGEDRHRQAEGERASRELIERLEREAAARDAQEARDEELARDVMREEQLFLSPGRPMDSAGDRHHSAPGKQRPASTPVKGPMDVYLGQMTPRVGGKRPVSPVQRVGTPTAAQAASSPTGSSKENSDPAAAAAAVAASRSASAVSTTSEDSIRPELSHFKPIRAAPRTPPRRRQDGALERPALVHALPRPPSRQWTTPSAASQRDAHARRGLNAAEIHARLGDGADEDDGGDSESGAAVAGKKRAASPRPGEGPAAKRLAAPPDAEIDLSSAELLAQQREAERQLELELADRRLAEQLQLELNRQQPVDRRKGSEDAYRLRRPARRGRSQLSIQESLGRSLSRSGARAGR